MKWERGVAALLLLLWLVVGGWGCNDHRERYDQALVDLATADGRVDVYFDAAQAAWAGIVERAEASLPPDAFPHASLTAALARAMTEMDGAIAAQEQRMAIERRILAFDFMAGAGDTRLLYHLDLEAQQAKLTLFQLTRSMYTALADAPDPSTYVARQLEYAERIGTANADYQSLDLARQRQQQRLSAGRSAD